MKKNTKKTARLVTRRELADLLDVHPGTVTKWERDGMPVAKRGGRGRPTLYDLARVLAWRVESVRPTSEALCLEQERAALARAQRSKIEQDMRARSGELVEASAVQAEYAEMATVVKARLRAIPSAIAAEVVAAAPGGPAPVAALLLARIDDALREMAAVGRSSDAEIQTWLAK